MIGGLGPESTIDYYRSIIARCRARSPQAEYPHIVINSLDVARAIAMLDAGHLDDLSGYLAEGVNALARAGADFGFIAANTPHIVFDQLKRRSSLPLLSIVHATADHTRKLGFKEVGLFGTGFTMQASFYPEEFQRDGIGLVLPQAAEREFIHEKYLGELLNNQFLPETRAEMLRIAQRMKDDDGVEAIVLAGTELPLLLRGSSEKIPFLDTTAIHVEAVVEELLHNPPDALS